MIRRSQLIAGLTGLSIVAIAWVGLDAQSSAAPDPAALQALRRQVERRFEPFPLIDGLALRPKAPMRGIRSIEITGGTIAVDGTPVTAAELRNRIGADADLVIQLTYLDPAARRALVAGDSTGAPDRAQPAAPGVLPERPEPPDRAARPEQPTPPVRPSRRDRSVWPRDNRVNIGGSVTVGPDEVIEGDVVAVGGSARVEGQVHGDVVAVGGSVELGPNAVVDQDVAVIGGSLDRAAGARIGGQIKEVGIGSFRGDWIAPRAWLGGWINRGLGSTFALLSTVTRGAVLCLLAALVVLLGGAYVDQISLRAAAEPFKAGAIGLLAQLLFLPLLIITILVLVVTIVGIPLLVLIPFVLLGLAVVGLVGFTAVAHRIGERVGRNLGWIGPSPYLTAFAGVVVILLPVLLARLALLAGGTGITLLWHVVAVAGMFVEYLAWTVGFGAVALVRFGRKAAIS